MDETTIRKMVREFFELHAVGRTAEDAFPAWWLHREFDLPSGEAISCSSSGSHDHGLDAFHLETRGRDPILHLVQAKLSASRPQVHDGIRGFQRTLERIEALLHRAPTANDAENTVWTRLAARLSRVEDLSLIVVHCRVLHLVSADSDALLSEAKTARTAFEEAAAVSLPDHKVRLSLSGPLEIGPGTVLVTPGKRHTLAFEGVEATEGRARLFIGLGTLADLVRLYEESGDSLFSKNVRLFNYRAAEKGPARHVKETLRRACIGDVRKRQDVLNFTMFHNGITLHATKVEKLDGNSVSVRNPGVLNGCQTVKSAWLFKIDRLLKNRIDEQAWKAIRVPLRVIETTDDELVRRITVSNNRQTAIRSSAFRSNDPVQLHLGERLKACGIYYERQEDAFQNLRKSEPRTLERDYPYSFDAPLTMEELAQSIAVAALDPAISVASKVSDLFDDATYEKLFAQQRLVSVHLLVFISNLLRCIHLALKDTKDKTSKLKLMVPSRFRFPVARALARWIVKHEVALVPEFGQEVIARPSSTHPFRERLRRLLSPQNSSIQTLLPELWTTSPEEWRSANDREAVEKLLRQLHVHDLDVFERYAELE